MTEELPKGWARVRLGDILLGIEAGKSFTCEPRPAEPDEWGVVKVSAMTWGTFNEKENKALPAHREPDPRFEIQPGDILVSRANTEAYVGAPVLVGKCRPRLLLSDKSLRLKPVDGIDPHWLVYALASPTARRQISAGSTGAQQSMRNISQSALAEIEVLLPPTVEQKRIVDALEDHLSRLDAAEKSLGVTLRRLDRLREAVMVPTNRIAVTRPSEAAHFPSPAGVDDGELPFIPSSWRWMRLGEVADVVGGVTKDAKRQAGDDYVDVPYLRVANVQRGHIDLTTIAHIRVPKAKAAHLFLQFGDVLLNEGGDRDKLGRGWIWEDQIPEMIHQNHVFRARIKDQMLDPRLLAWHANGFGRRWFEANGKQSVNLASISLRKIKMFPVPIPPKAEQAAMAQEIEEQLSILDNAADLSRAAHRKAAALRRALLTYAFSGKLVPQNPEDEPASELLTRAKGALVGGLTSPRVPHARSAAVVPKLARGAPSGIQEELPL
ncbi:restriction endonuclease subunit S [Dactylosporangium sp. NPDC000244]|uniref:restriction endonuclease subunit S n=1 Tax=Dactylosporangium sp. NPDC000244 TaxID=3154365 RepID=UPI00332F983B